MASTATSTRRELKDYGPVQFPARLGLPLWAFGRALRAGLIPRADPATGRWPASVVNAAVAGLEQIRVAAGAQPDVGAGRAAEVLSARFGIDVDPDVLLELDRMGLIPVAGDYKGCPLYDGRALETFEDRAALQQAISSGRLLNRDEVAGHLRVRRSDVGHLVNAGWLEPVTWVHSSWQRRRKCRCSGRRGRAAGASRHRLGRGPRRAGREVIAAGAADNSPG